MVLLVQKWDILPDKFEEYNEWAPSAIKRLLSVPGVVEFRAYRPASGSHQVAITFEFENMGSWASWYENEDVQKIRAEMQGLTCNRFDEIWGPSPIVPAPIRPGG